MASFKNRLALRMLDISPTNRERIILSTVRPDGHMLPNPTRRLKTSIKNSAFRGINSTATSIATATDLDTDTDSDADANANDHHTQTHTDSRRTQRNQLNQTIYSSSFQPGSFIESIIFWVYSTILKQSLVVIFFLIHFVFDLWMRFRQTYNSVLYTIASVLHYHHHTPGLIRRDFKMVNSLPHHLSVILPPIVPNHTSTKSKKLTAANHSTNHFYDVGELAAWCASVGIRVLSVYERSGILKTDLESAHRAIVHNLHNYFPIHMTPTVSVHAPNTPQYPPVLTDPELKCESSFRNEQPYPAHFSLPSASSAEAGAAVASPQEQPQSPTGSLLNQSAAAPHLQIIFLSALDSKQSIVELTKTLTGMCQHGRLDPSNITIDLIDAQLCEHVMPAPDLLICFCKNYTLDGYPPWHLRLTELFHLPDNPSGVGYQIFVKALRKYSTAERRFGK